MTKQTLRWVSVAVMLLVCSGALVGCHADENDPKGQAEELADPVRREHAVARLQGIFAQRMAENKGDRTTPPLVEFKDVTIENMVKTYVEHPEDSQNGLKLLTLMEEMRDPRAMPALLKALDWTAEVNEDHAVTAARTMTVIEIPGDKRADAIAGICKALTRIDGVRGVDNRMRKSFIEVLGKLNDKGATETLALIATRQDASQNFLFNILAAQQLSTIADPAAIPALIKGLYLFALDNPAMRMNDVAGSALVAIGKPALQPLLKVLKGEDEEANKTVKAYIAAIKGKDKDAAAKLDVRAIVVGEAAYALGKLGFREALDPLIAETQSEDDLRRTSAALALVSVNREPADTQRVVDAIQAVYDKVEKQSRPQLLVAMRHLYASEAMPFMMNVIKQPEDELLAIKLYAFSSYAMLANKAEAAPLNALLEKDELFKGQLGDHDVALKAAEACDKNVECWVGKLGDPNKVVLRKAATMIARYGRGNEKAIEPLVKLFQHSDLEVRNEALSAVDFIATKGSKLAADKIQELDTIEGGRSIWNNFKREALPTRSRLLSRS